MEEGGPLIQYDYCPYKKRQFGNGNIHREEHLCKGVGRYGSYASTRQGAPKIARKFTQNMEPQGEAWNQFALRRNKSCWHLDLELQVSRTVGWSFFVVLNHNFMLLCSGRHGQNNTIGIFQLRKWRLLKMSVTESGHDSGLSCSVAIAPSHSPPSSLTLSVAFLLPGSAHSNFSWETRVIPPRLDLQKCCFVCRSWREDIWISVLLVLIRAT